MGNIINHPSHYNASGRKECIEEMEEMYGIDAVREFCKLNAYKYNYRAELKGNKELDLQKAEWYKNKVKELNSRDPVFKIANSYGKINQTTKLIEELGELQSATSRLLLQDPRCNNFAEEIADVEIMLKQIKYLFLLDREVEEIKHNKIARQLSRLEK